MKRIIRFTIAAAALLFGLAVDVAKPPEGGYRLEFSSAEAKGGGGRSGGFSSGSSFRSAPSSPSPSRTVSTQSAPKPAAAPPPSPPKQATTPPSPPATSGGFGPGGTAAKADTGKAMAANVPAPSAVDRQASRQISTQAFDNGSAVSASKVRQSPEFKAATANQPKSTYTPERVREVRTEYVTRHNNVYIPSYQPVGSYGGFSDTFMWMMMYDAMFAHNRRDDPDYRKWRQEADDRAREDSKLREQLAKLDAEVKTLRDKGAPQDPTYIPKNVPAEVVFSEKVLTEESSSPWGTIALVAGVLAVCGFGCLFFFNRRNSYA